MIRNLNVEDERKRVSTGEISGIRNVPSLTDSRKFEENRNGELEMKSGFCIAILKEKRKEGQTSRSGTLNLHLHSRKVSLSVWSDRQKVLFFELLQDDQTINSDKYYTWLDKLREAVTTS